MAQRAAAPIGKEETEIKALDEHIERLKAKLAFLIESCDDTSADLLHHDEKLVWSKKRYLMQWNRDGR